MLKRTQIMINEWMVDYVKSIVDEYDLSFSEVVRVTLCLQFIKIVAEFYPEYKPKVSDNRLFDVIRKYKERKLSSEEFHRFISEVYFEARKATELRLNALQNNPLSPKPKRRAGRKPNPFNT
jgi:hypothetical protein